MKKEHNKVIGKLVASYDLSPSSAKDVKSINYLYVYEYEYNGKKYSYSEHKCDSFDPVMEEIELYFDKDPGKAFRMSNNKRNDNNGKLITTIFVIVVFVIFIYLLVMVGKSFIKNPIVTILIIILFIIGIIFSKIKAKKHKNLNQLLKEALSENRFATAYLKKNTFLLHENGSREYYEKTIQYNHNRAKYEYEYNGKKYKTTLYFSEIPPQVIKVYFNKNPKDVFYYTK